jgi:hypothetical protein
MRVSNLCAEFQALLEAFQAAPLVIDVTECSVCSSQLLVAGLTMMQRRLQTRAPTRDVR